MQKALIVLIIAAAALTGCNKKSSTAPPKDQVEQKLQEVAGGGATNCGRIAQGGDYQQASNCAMQAAQAKKPFYVAYEMPGLTVAVAGASDGKLYTVQSQSGGAAGQNAPGSEPISAQPCPAELRVAQSGRVTCTALGGGMGMGMMGGASPHGGMALPPAGAENPHGGVAMPPDMANPHGGTAMPPAGTPNPHGDQGKKPAPNRSASK